MRRRSLQLLFGVAVGVLTGLILFIGMLIGQSFTLARETDLHEMLHKAVPLDANETAVLEAKEAAFINRRGEIEARLRIANAALADAIAKDPTWSPAVEAGTKQVEAAAASLQRETLVHVFEMRNGLKPEHRAAYDQVLLQALRRGAP